MAAGITMSAYRKDPRGAIGVALDVDRLTAVLPNEGRGAGTPWTRALTPPDADGSWADLASTLDELKTLVGRRRRLFVALMPTLAQLRLIELPGVTEEEAARVVRRDPSRFFPTRGEPLVVEVEATGRRAHSPFVVAVAPRQLVEAIGSAAETSGWSLGGIVPAPLAWTARLPSHGGPCGLLIHLDDHIELLRVRGHALTSYRRLPHGTDVSAGDEVIASESEAAAVAARYVGRVAGPVLLPDDVRAGVRRSERWAVRVRFALAGVLLVATAAVELAGMQHERTRIAGERSRIRQSVMESMAIRESIAVVRERLAALRDAAAREPRWSDVVADVAGVLPSDAYLLALRGDRDSLHVEGVATRAAPVFDAMRMVSGVSDVQAEAPIRQEVHDDRATSERFVLAALLAGANAAQGTVMPNAKRLPAPGGGR